MKKPNKEMLIEIIGAIILLALIGGTVACIIYEPPESPMIPTNGVSDYTLSR
ncbi:MAG: hypothetical protein HDT42_08535 [Ruminococcaceae bacterium]|nr:hypothetical protein [Oscillospiraceae bacterium]